MLQKAYCKNISDFWACSIYLYICILTTQRLQDHRRVEAGDVLRSYSPTHPLRAGSARTGCSEPCTVRFWISPRREIHNLSWQPVLVSDHIHRKKKKLFLKFKCNFLDFSLCPFALILSQDSHCILTYIDEILPEPSLLRRNIPNPLSLFPLWEMLKSFKHICDPSLNSAPVSLVPGCPELDTAL